MKETISLDFHFYVPPPPTATAYFGHYIVAEMCIPIVRPLLVSVYDDEGLFQWMS